MTLADVLAFLIGLVTLSVLFLGVWAFLCWVRKDQGTWSRRPPP